MMLTYLCISSWCITNYPKPQCLPTINIYYGVKYLWVSWVVFLVLPRRSCACVVSCGSWRWLCWSWLPLSHVWKLAGLGWSCEKTGLIFLWFLISCHTLLGFSHGVGKDLRERGSIQDLLRSRLKTEAPLLLPLPMKQSNVQDQLLSESGEIDPTLDGRSCKVTFERVWIWRGY